MASTRSSCEVREKRKRGSEMKKREKLRDDDFDRCSPSVHRKEKKEGGGKNKTSTTTKTRPPSPRPPSPHQTLNRLLLPVRRRHPRPPLPRQEDRKAQVLRLPGVCQPGRRGDRGRRDGRLPDVFAAPVGQGRGPGGRAPCPLQGRQPHLHEGALEAARGQEGEQEADARGGREAAGAGGQGRRQAGGEDQELRDRLPVRAVAGEHPGGGGGGGGVIGPGERRGTQNASRNCPWSGGEREEKAPQGREPGAKGDRWQSRSKEEGAPLLLLSSLSLTPLLASAGVLFPSSAERESRGEHHRTMVGAALGGRRKGKGRERKNEEQSGSVLPPLFFPLLAFGFERARAKSKRSNSRFFLFF